MEVISPHSTSQSKLEREWKLEEIPACDEGTILLRHFAIAQPETFASVQPCDFEQLDNPAFAGFPEWDAFAEHRSACGKCNEVQACVVVMAGEGTNKPITEAFHVTVGLEEAELVKSLDPDLCQDLKDKSLRLATELGLDPRVVTGLLGLSNDQPPHLTIAQRENDAAAIIKLSY